MKSLWTTFRYTLKNLRWQIIGWGIGLALYGLMIVPMYESLGAEPEKFEQMIAGYPPEFLAFFGADVNSPLTPQGFLGMYAFSMLPVIIGVFSVIAGSGLIVGDEEHGRLDLIIAHPVGRVPFYWGRFLGLSASALSIIIIGWLGFSTLLGRSSLGVTWYQMAVPFLTLFIQMLLFATLALVLSMLLPSRNLAAMVSGAFLVISYIASSLAFLNDRMEVLSRFLPYHYYQSVLSFKELNLTWFFSLLVISLVMAIVAAVRFSHRDIRLSGEGSWRKR
jgi:ABC-2 type transport system permease protein